ncbi:MAG: hypothetical protein ABH824_04060 [Nanoarchaeota archaeon]|nr:hypothetical protein [Nanoarchaeota archaeon]MBU1631979.1 hypothetical protein [Nanoarchaeota archaeon]MBU1876089.1 hypothetical protein [Nanoarchaeota archaeon]
MYSRYLKQDKEHITSLRRRIRTQDVDEALIKAKEGITRLEDAAILFNAQDDQYHELCDISNRRTLQHHGDSIGLIAPLYISSYCVNDCEGCNYRRSNKEIERKVLSLDEFEDELGAISELGYLTLELVGGSFTPNAEIYQKFLQLIEYAKQRMKTGKIENLAFSIDALTEKEYSDFADADLTLIQWQESYDRRTYRQMVGENGTKSDMNKRMNAYEEWITAGGKKFGLGILAGLSDDFFEDVMSVIAHGEYLEREYGIAPSVIGIPRMQEADVDKAGTLKQRDKISDEDLLKIVAVYRLCFPQANIVASTREPQNVIRQILYTGATFTNHTCSTNVGGYPNLVKILRGDISSDEKKKQLEEIQRGKNQQFFHPDPIFEEMKRTIESVGRKINPKKEF